VQAFENDSTELTDGLGSPQFYFVLSVDLVSIIKKKKKGGLHFIGSPAQGNAPENMVFDDSGDL
jgi:hypothetical protein